MKTYMYRLRHGESVQERGTIDAESASEAASTVARRLDSTIKYMNAFRPSPDWDYKVLEVEPIDSSNIPLMYRVIRSGDLTDEVYEMNIRRKRIMRDLEDVGFLTAHDTEDSAVWKEVRRRVEHFLRTEHNRLIKIAYDSND